MTVTYNIENVAVKKITTYPAVNYMRHSSPGSVNFFKKAIYNYCTVTRLNQLQPFSLFAALCVKSFVPLAWNLCLLNCI